MEVAGAERMDDLPGESPAAVADDASPLRVASVAIENHREVAVSGAVEGFRSLLSPSTDLLAQTRVEQQQLLSTVQEAKQRSDVLEQRIAAVEPTFARLPLYIAKLELMGRNLKTLHENAAKTKALARKLQDEVHKLVGH
jgi:hypothetical protein